MIHGIEVKIIWLDDHLTEVSVSAGNGAFSAQCTAYLGKGSLAEAAENFAGFPMDVSDARRVLLGNFDPKSAKGGISIGLFCRDLAGHAIADIRVADIDNQTWWGAPEQSAHFFANVEPAAIDEFVSDLRRLEADQKGTAILRFVR